MSRAEIGRQVQPADWTRDNIATMRSQMESLGVDFEWVDTVTTCDAEYYGWTQSLFIRLFHAGLAYQKNAAERRFFSDISEHADGERRGPVST